MKTLNTDFERELFNGHTEAEKWFHEKYPDQFIIKGSGDVDGEKIYFYHLIIDQECYKKDIKILVEKGIADGLELSLSYYIVGILEDGRVHVMY